MFDLKFWEYKRIVYRLETEKSELLDKIDSLELENRTLVSIIEHKENVIKTLKKGGSKNGIHCKKIR